MEAPVLNVQELYVGTDLDADAAAGANTITPTDIYALDFQGGQALIGDPEAVNELVTYNAIPTDAEGQPTATTVTLTTNLVNAYTVDAGDRIIVAQAGVPLRTRKAYLKSSQQEEPIEATIPLGLWDRLPLGTRDANTAEVVIADYDNTGQLVILSVEARPPQQSAEFIIPGTFTQGQPSDSTPPASSPTPTVRGGLGSLVVEWDAVTNLDPVTYEVHVSTANGFTPDATNLIEETRSTLSWVRALADGTLLDYTTTYYVKLVAKDKDGAAPASGQATGTPTQVDSPDIHADAVQAKHLLADDALFDAIRSLLIVSNTLKTAESGQRVEIDVDGVRWYDSTGLLAINFPTASGQPAILNADLVADTIDVLNGMNLRSALNTMDPGSVLTLQSVLSDPTVGPTIGLAWDTLPLTGGDSAQAGGVGLFYASNGGSGGATASFIASQDPGLGVPSGHQSVLEEYNAATGALLRTLLTADQTSQVSTTRFRGAVYATVGGTRKLFVLAYRSAQQMSNVGWYLYRYDAGTLALEASVGPLADVSSAQAAVLGLVNGNPTVICTNSPTTRSVAKLLTYNGSTLALSSSQALSGRQYDPGDLDNGIVGVVDDGTSLWVSVRNDSVYGWLNHRYNKTTWAYESNHDFSGAAGYGHRGLTWDGTRFWTRAGGAPQLFKHTTWDWTTEASKYWIAYTWYDGTHETKVSPKTSIDLSIYRRARLSITVPTFPPGVTKARVYAERNASAPANTSLHLQAAPTYVDTDSGVSIHEFDFNSAGAAPPTTNGFGAGTPAEVKASPAQAGIAAWSLRGGGSFKLPTGTTANINAWTPPAGAGSLAWDTTRGCVVVYTGSAWIPVGFTGRTRWAPTFEGVDQGLAMTQNRIYIVELPITEPTVLTGVEYLGAAAAAGNIRGAIFNADGSSRLAQSLAVAAVGNNTRGQLPFTATLAVTPGKYLLAVQGTTVTPPTIRFAYYAELSGINDPGSPGIPTSVPAPTAAPSGLAPGVMLNTY